MVFVEILDNDERGFFIENVGDHIIINKFKKSEIVKVIGDIDSFPGSFATVYKMRYMNGSGFWALRIFTKKIDHAKERYQLLSDFLEKNASPYFPSFKYHPTGIRYYSRSIPFVSMEWIDGKNLNDYIAELFQNYDGKVLKDKLFKIREQLIHLLLWMNKRNFLHGDLHHANIIVSKRDGSLKIVDFDNIKLPGLPNSYKHTTTGLPEYNNPNGNYIYDYHIDNFSGFILVLSLMVLELYPGSFKNHDFSDKFLFSVNDYFDIETTNNCTKISLFVRDNIDGLVEFLLKRLKSEIGNPTTLPDINKILDYNFGFKEGRIFDSLIDSL